MANRRWKICVFISLVTHNFLFSLPIPMVPFFRISLLSLSVQFAKCLSPHFITKDSAFPLTQSPAPYLFLLLFIGLTYFFSSKLESQFMALCQLQGEEAHGLQECRHMFFVKYSHYLQWDYLHITLAHTEMLTGPCPPSLALQHSESFFQRYITNPHSVYLYCDPLFSLLFIVKVSDHFPSHW